MSLIGLSARSSIGLTRGVGAGGARRSATDLAAEQTTRSNESIGAAHGANRDAETGRHLALRRQPCAVRERSGDDAHLDRVGDRGIAGARSVVEKYIAYVRKHGEAPPPFNKRDANYFQELAKGTESYLDGLADYARQGIVEWKAAWKGWGPTRKKGWSCALCHQNAFPQGVSLPLPPIEQEYAPLHIISFLLLNARSNLDK